MTPDQIHEDVPLHKKGYEIYKRREWKSGEWIAVDSEDSSILLCTAFVVANASLRRTPLNHRDCR